MMGKAHTDGADLVAAIAEFETALPGLVVDNRYPRRADWKSQRNKI